MDGKSQNSAEISETVLIYDHKGNPIELESRSVQTDLDTFSGRGLLGGSNVSGVDVTPVKALSVSAVFAAIQAIACDVAKLPINVMLVRPDGGKVPQPKHPLQKVLNRPNTEMTRVSFTEALVSSALLYGVGYAQIIRNGYGVPIQLWPIESWRVQPWRDINGILKYHVYPGGTYPVAARPTEVTTLNCEDLICLKNFGFNGILGCMITKVGSESLGLSLAMQQYAASLFGNGARPGGVISTPDVLTPEAARKLKENWNAAHGGAAKQNGTAVLEKGATWTSVNTTPENAQLVESRMFMIEEVCRWFRVTPQQLHHLVKTAFNSAEQFAISYVTDCLMSWFVRLEEEYEFKLLDEDDSLSVDIDEGKLIRGDAASIKDGAGKALLSGLITRNEGRAMIKVNPVEGGDVFLVPKNSVPVGVGDSIEDQQKLMAPAPAPAPKPVPTTEPDGDEVQPPELKTDTPPEPPEEDGQVRQLVQGIKPLLEAEIRRLLRVEADKVVRASKKPRFDAWADAFYKGHADHVRAALSPCITTLAGMAGLVTKRDLTQAVAQTIPLLVNKHIAESRSDLTDPDGLSERVAGWEEFRASAYVESAVEQLIEVMK